MSSNKKIGIVVAIMVVLGAGVSYASANNYDTELYGDAVRGIIGACAVYIGAWLKSE